MEAKYFIYALCEPDGATIRYIGCTANMWKRLHSHYGHSSMKAVRQWINSLREVGRIPVMILLREVFGLEAGIAAEREEIQKRAGSDLLNFRETGKPITKHWGRLLECGGKKMTLSQWSKELGISRQAIQLRLQSHAPEIALARGKAPGLPLEPGKTLNPIYKPTCAELSIVGGEKQERFSHASRRERRKEMAAALAAGERRESVAARYGVTTGTVDAALKEFGKTA